MAQQPSSTATPPAAPDYGYGLRYNNGDASTAKPKGLGFLGPLQRPDGGVMSEYSIGMEIGGKETEIPSIVPTLTKEEVRAILTARDGEKLPASVYQKARAHAEQRIAEGKDPFAAAGEQQALYPEFKRAATPATADPVADALRKTPTTNGVRAAVWDAYYKSPTADADFVQALKIAELPQPIKAYLFDLKAGTPSTPPWTLRYPKIAAAARLGLDALPGAGMVVGAAIGTPETGGAGTIPAGAVGAGVGRGARDLIAENVGLEPTTGAFGKTARIAGDIALTAATSGAAEGASSIIKDPAGYWQAAKASLIKILPPPLRPIVSAMTSPTQAANMILTRPGWQTPESIAWAKEYAPEDFNAKPLYQQQAELPTNRPNPERASSPPPRPNAPTAKPFNELPLAEQMRDLPAVAAPAVRAGAPPVLSPAHPSPQTVLDWIAALKPSVMNEFQKGFVAAIKDQASAGRNVTATQVDLLRELSALTKGK